MNPVIVCIAKKEQLYIEEFVRYHLAMGFQCIYVYDNEDVPTYAALLASFGSKVHVIHMPGNNNAIGIQYIALDDFTKNIMRRDGCTHVAHIDIDEFIVLKRHACIQDFITEYIKGNCAGIGMNWRIFGSSGQTEYSPIPVTQRFTRREHRGNKHIKTLFDVSKFIRYRLCHNIMPVHGTFVKTTENKVISGPFNTKFHFDVIQLNHYKSKTLAEFREIRKRGRADTASFRQITENVDESFKEFDLNDVEDMHAADFYKRSCQPTNPE